jgi:hypothetical protein
MVYDSGEVESDEVHDSEEKLTEEKLATLFGSVSRIFGTTGN